MDTSPRFAMPMIMANQAHKHLTHNEALVQLETLVQPVVLDMAATAPPASPNETDCVIVGVGATGAFAGQDNAIAAWIGSAWHVHTPQAGWVVVEATTGAAYVFNGTGWVSLVGEALKANQAMVGINAAASTSNRLTVAGDATLLTAETLDHRLTINKAGAANTASMVFQSGWSGRAEMGLAGHDGFGIKVSDDGTNWHDALAVDPATGTVSMAQRPVATATLSGGATSFPAAREAGFQSLPSAQGGFALGTAFTAPITGSPLTVPASGTYAFTLSLRATGLGGVTLLANSTTALVAAVADISGSTDQTFQLSGLVSLTQNDTLSLRFDDAASCVLAATDCYLAIHRL